MLEVRSARLAALELKLLGRMFGLRGTAGSSRLWRERVKLVAATLEGVVGLGRVVAKFERKR